MRKLSCLWAVTNLCLPIATALALCPAPLWGQPSISSVQGTVAAGQSITISGSGFGAKATAAPLLWADFSEGNTNPSPLGQITSWDLAESPVLDANPSTDCHSANCMTSGSCFWELGPGCSNTTPGEGNGMAIGVNPGGLVGTYGQQMYINFWRKIGGKYASVIQSSTGPNVKWLRIWGDNATPGGEAPHACPDTYTNEVACNGGLPMYTEYAGSWEIWAGTWLIPTATWRNEEYNYQYNSGTGKADGTFDVQINQILESSTTNWQSDSTAVPMTGQGDIDIQDEFSPNICPSGSGNSYMPQSGDQVWYDSIYIDSTWQRAMICDASTWAGRTHCEIQIPSAWSDNGTTASAKVTVHQGSFANGTQAYLYVVGSTNDANTNGFPVTFGGSASGGVPVQVTGLTATPSTGQVALAWTAASGATSYNVERSTSSSGPFTSIAAPSGTSYTDIGVTAGTTYYYEVVGVSSAGTGPASNVVSATVPTQVSSPSFTLSLNPTSVTLNSGQSASTTITVTPQNGFNQQVSFTCSGLPLAATCSFSPSTVTPGGNTPTTTLTIATKAAMNPLHAPSPFGRHGSMEGETLLACVLFGFGGLFRLRRRWKSFFCSLAVLAGLGLAICGCGGLITRSSSGNGGATTPAGTSTITVTATAGSLSQSPTFTLTVQ
jgi:hypothetical protein